MATMTLNMNGLPAIKAINDSYSFLTTHADNLILPVLDNDFLGFGGSKIISFEDNNVESNVGVLSIIDDGALIKIVLSVPGGLIVGVYTFLYTIKDSFNRTSTATVTITITS